ARRSGPATAPRGDRAARGTRSLPDRCGQPPRRLRQHHSGAPGTDGMIEASGLSRSYGDFTAVRDLTFAVQPGEVVGLVGPNGAGKTTTLRCLVGIIRPTAGTVRIAGHDLMADALSAKAQLAFIPDEPHLFPHLTVAEHLQFAGRIYGVSDADERGAALLEELELTDRRDSLPDEVSRGMKQKLAIACGLLHRPGALLLDEPLTGLDPGAIRRMKRT